MELQKINPMKKIFSKLKNRKGGSEIIALCVVAVVLIGILSGSITMLGQVSRIDDLGQIAQQMAREVSLAGRTDGKVAERLEKLEDTMNMDVDMTVEGSYIGGSAKLQTESDFTVIITYDTEYFIGFLRQAKEKTYVAKASGTVEEYHK